MTPERSPTSEGTVAAACAILGEKDHAFCWLEDEYKGHDRMWLAEDISLENLKSEPMYDALRSDRRYQDLLRRIGLPQ